MNGVEIGREDKRNETDNIARGGVMVAPGNDEFFFVRARTYARKMHVRERAYLIQFGNIIPIERINDYREDMKLSGPAGRVNCHYPLFPTEERENARGFLGTYPAFGDLNY